MHKSNDCISFQSFKYDELVYVYIIKKNNHFGVIHNLIPKTLQVTNTNRNIYKVWWKLDDTWPECAVVYKAMHR